MLEPLSLPDRVAVFSQAVKKAAAFAGIPTPPIPEPALFTGERAEKTLRDPLSLIMAAVVGVRNGVPHALSLTRVELAHAVADLLVGRRLDVLVEGADPRRPGFVLGTSCRSVTVAFAGHAPALLGRRVPVLAEAVADGSLRARPLPVFVAPLPETTRRLALPVVS